MNVTKLQLPDGATMPIIGLGTRFGFGTPNKEEVTDILNSAVEIGYRHFNTAPLYKNENIIGEVLNEYFSKGVLQRNEVFITSKIWPSYMESKELTRLSVKQSLEKLNLGYVDLFLIHCPTALKYTEPSGEEVFLPAPGNKVQFINDRNCIINTWEVLEEYVDKGLIKSIGVSNFNIEQMSRIQNIAKHPLSCNEVEINLYLQQPQLVQYCKDEKITIVAYAPLGSPNQGRRGPSKGPIEDDLVKELAWKYEKTEAQVLLRFLVQGNIGFIPKSKRKEKLRENFNIFDFSLNDLEMRALTDKDKNERIFTLDFIKGHIEYPFA